MTISSFPPRAIRLFGTDSVTVPKAVPPFWITTTFSTMTSSKTSNSTRSFTCASAEEIVCESRSLTGVPSSSTKGALTLVAGCCPSATKPLIGWATIRREQRMVRAKTLKAPFQLLLKCCQSNLSRDETLLCSVRKELRTCNCPQNTVRYRLRSLICLPNGL